MKRFLGILICVIAFSGCDDGDLIVDTIDFDEVATSTCPENNLLFKIKESEVLILDVLEDNFKEEPTDEDDPIVLDINSTNQVVYDFYDGKVTTSSVCDILKPVSPKLFNKWEAVSGKIEITTEIVKSLDETDNSTRITGYKHSIVFRDITFGKGDGTTQFYETFVFGEYVKSIPELDFDFPPLLTLCDSGLLYTYKESESLTLDIDPDLLANADTPPDQPRVGKIELNKNKLVYRTYEGQVLTSDYFCKATDPLVPTVAEEWFGKVGGTIEVTTTTSGPNTYKHTIVLKNVTMENGKNNFQLGDNYKYGELQTIDN